MQAFGGFFDVQNKIQNVVSVAMWKNCSNAEIYRDKSAFQQFKNLSNLAVSLHIGHILNPLQMASNFVTSIQNLY